MVLSAPSSTHYYYLLKKSPSPVSLSHLSPKPSKHAHFHSCITQTTFKFSSQKTTTRASVHESNLETDSALLVREQDKSHKEVEEGVKVLKNAAKARRVPSEEILSAFSVLEKAKLDPSGFLETLGGTKSPGRTWMLIFTAEKGLKSGKYFPITAVQRFDAAGERIENGVYLGSLGFLTFEGRLSWKNRILAFRFERIRIKIGPFNPFEVQFGGKEEREPSTTKDPFFIWFYIDEEIAVARGRSGGTAFWVRCRKVPAY